MTDNTPDFGLEQLSASLLAEDHALVEQEIKGFASIGISLAPGEAYDLLWPNREFDWMARWVIAAGLLASDGEDRLEHEDLPV